jgi:hypothetical protein
MLDLVAELRRIVDALESAGVVHALAGGLAVSIYTRPRATEDIDLLVAPDHLARAVSAVAPLGFGRAGEPIPVSGGRLDIQRLIRIEGTDLLPVDLLVPRDAALAALLADRRAVEWEGRSLWILSVDGLRALKRLRGSAQDRADLEALGPEG